MTKTKIINEGSESIVSLTTSNSGIRTITKTRKSGGTTNYLFEAFVYRLVKKLGSHVPEVISVDNSQLVMTALNGETLDDKTELFTENTIFDAIAKDLVLNRHVTFEGYGHAIKNGTTYRGEYSSWSAFLSARRHKLLESRIFSKEQKFLLAEKWDLLLPSILLDKGMLVHGDFALSAIFVDRDTYEGIIDFGDAFIGDPLMDLAYFRFKEITKTYGLKIYDMLATSYALYSGIKRSDIDTSVLFYMIYWAIERSHAANLDQGIVEKFIEKTDSLIELLVK